MGCQISRYRNGGVPASTAPRLRPNERAANDHRSSAAAAAPVAPPATRSAA